MGLFVVFEGVEGSGKTTQCGELQRRLSGLKRACTLVREPGCTPTGERVRDWLKTGADITPLAELFLLSAARAALVESVVRPSLERGETVICDRYTYSTVAYQGRGRGIDLETIERLNDLASHGLAPDIVVLLDLPVGDGLARKRGGVRDRFEAEDLGFHERVRRAYLDMAGREPGRWLTINAAQARAAISDAVWERVSAMLDESPG